MKKVMLFAFVFCSVAAMSQGSIGIAPVLNQNKKSGISIIPSSTINCYGYLSDFPLLDDTLFILNWQQYKFIKIGLDVYRINPPSIEPVKTGQMLYDPKKGVIIITGSDDSTRTFSNILK